MKDKKLLVHKIRVAISPNKRVNILEDVQFDTDRIKSGFF